MKFDKKEKEALVQDIKTATDDDFMAIESGISEFQTSHKNLCHLLGKPNSEGDGEKIDVEWVFNYNGHSLSIHNWKDGPNYLGAEGTPVSRITEWHISGGRNENDIVKEFVHRFLTVYPDLNLPPLTKKQKVRIIEKMKKLTDTGWIMVSDFLDSI